MSVRSAEVFRKPARRHSRRLFDAASAVLVCAAVSLSAHAAQWSRIGTGGNGLVTYYADGVTRKEGQLLRVRLLYDYKETQESPHTDEDHHSDFLSTTVIAYFDCKNRQIAVEQMKNYEKNMGRGKLIGESADRSARKPQDVSAPADEVVLKWVCSRAR